MITAVMASHITTHLALDLNLKFWMWASPTKALQNKEKGSGHFLWLCQGTNDFCKALVVTNTSYKGFLF